MGRFCIQLIHEKVASLDKDNPRAGIKLFKKMRGKAKSGDIAGKVKLGKSAWEGSLRRTRKLHKFAVVIPPKREINKLSNGPNYGLDSFC